MVPKSIANGTKKGRKDSNISFRGSKRVPRWAQRGSWQGPEGALGVSGDRGGASGGPWEPSGRPGRPFEDLWGGLREPSGAQTGTNNRPDRFRKSIKQLLCFITFWRLGAQRSGESVLGPQANAKSQKTRVFIAFSPRRGPVRVLWTGPGNAQSDSEDRRGERGSGSAGQGGPPPSLIIYASFLI